VDVKNADSLIRPGMYGYASLVLDSRTDALAVPVQAIAQGARPTVMTIGPEGRIEERVVKIGLETPNVVEILSGVQANDLVVIGSRAGLKPGVRVDPKILSATDLAGGE
jgi:membrane fusion protein, macrolide-specific efflux system